MDVTELILFQHQEQRRMFALLDDIDKDDAASLAPVWSQLSILLEVHAEAEEKFFYPKLLASGTGAGGEDSAASETRDAVKDHNQIRDAVSKAGQHPLASSDWWQAVIEARIANSDHMAEEEREDLADFRRHASLQERHDIAIEFAAYEADHAGGISAQNDDPEQYVRDHTGGEHAQ